MVPIYRFRAIIFLDGATIFGREKIVFLPQNIKKSLSRAGFQEALIVAPLFLVICLDIFGAWINQKIFFLGHIFL